MFATCHCIAQGPSAPLILGHVLFSAVYHPQGTGELPEGFELALNEPNDPPPVVQQQPPPKPKRNTSRNRRKSAFVDDDEDTYSRFPKKRSVEEDSAAAAAAKRRHVAARQLRILRHLGLAPPAGSPYADHPCLVGAAEVAKTLAANG